jgi:phosphatidylcholine synthase
VTEPMTDAAGEPEGHNTRMAWLIHVFTSTGVVAGFLGLLSVFDGSPRAALIWFIVAVVIDGLDGPMARRYDVGRAIPSIDGNTLDLVIDYVTCVVGPAFFFHQFGMFPEQGGVALIMVALILVSSLYCFANTNLMTPDHYFNGFPAMWNLVAAVLWVLQARPWINVIVTVVFVVLTFLPVQFIHAFRTRDFRQITIPLMVVWLSALLYVIWIIDEKTRDVGCVSNCLPGPAEFAQGIIYVGMFWVLGVGLWRTLRGPSPHADAEPAPLQPRPGPVG